MFFQKSSFWQFLGALQPKVLKTEPRPCLYFFYFFTISYDFLKDSLDNIDIPYNSCDNP